jgi:hypothetical protein
MPSGTAGGAYDFSLAGDTKGVLKLDISYAKPGYYDYTISSNERSPRAGYTYESKVYKVMVMIVNGPNGLVQGALTSKDASSGNKYDNLQFEPRYYQKRPTPDPDPDPDPNPGPSPDPDPNPTPNPDPAPTPTPTPEPDPTPDPNPDPNPNPGPTPNPTPNVVPGNQVLGARRTAETSGAVDGAAVLGARRSGTDDPTNTLGRIITIIAAATIGFIMVFMKRKSREERKK